MNPVKNWGSSIHPFFEDVYNVPGYACSDVHLACIPAPLNTIKGGKRKAFAPTHANTVVDSLPDPPETLLKGLPFSPIARKRLGSLLKPDSSALYGYFSQNLIF